MLPTPNGARSFAALLTLLAPAGLCACNAIFGIEPGMEATSDSGTAGTTSTGGSTGGTMSTGGAAGAMTGGSAGCAPGGGPTATGKSYKQFFSNGPDHETARAAAFDKGGDLVVAGTITGPVDFGGGPLPYTGSMDYPNETVYVARFTPDAEHLGSVSFSSTLSARAHAVAVDPTSGDILVAGDFVGTLDIGGTMLTSFEADYVDMFVVRLSHDLKPQWAKKFGQQYRQHPFEIAVDSKGYILITGSSFTKVDLGGGPIGGDAWSSFVVKLDADGGFIWNQVYDHFIPHTSDDDNVFGLALAVLPGDDVLVGGTFDGPTYLGGTQVIPKGGADAYLVRLAGADKTLVWQRTYAGKGGDSDGNQWVTSLAHDPCGDIYVAGAFTQGIEAGGAVVPAKDSDPATADMFLFKLSSAGDPIWQKTYGDVGWQEPTAVRTDPFGNVALVGFLKDAAGFKGVDFGPGIGVLSPNVPDPAPGYFPDGFVVKLGASGAGLWGHRLGDADLQWTFDAAFDAKGQLAVTGPFSSSMVLDAAQTPLSADGYDMYVGWYDKAQ